MASGSAPPLAQDETSRSEADIHMTICEQPVSDRSVWLAKDYASDRSWLNVLSAADLNELDSALRAVKARGMAPPDFGREDFLIPGLGARLETFGHQLDHGRGFFVIRGLPIERYSLDDIKTIYWAIGTHLGNPVLQNKAGDLVSHVEDRGDDYSMPNVRLYSTAAAANPHNDPSDVVGLLCVRTAPTGGASMIASATAIYKRVAQQHPEHLAVLARGFPHAVRGEGSSRSTRETTPPIPVFSYHQGKLSCCLNSKSSRTARELQGEPLTALENEAIKCVEDLANDPEFYTTMDFRPGDMQFLNNYVILHNRTAFENGPDPAQRRLLLRLWLNRREGRALAPGFGDRFNNGSRGGVPAQAVDAAARQ